MNLIIGRLVIIYLKKTLVTEVRLGIDSDHTHTNTQTHTNTGAQTTTLTKHKETTRTKTTDTYERHKRIQRMAPAARKRKIRAPLLVVVVNR